jgi:acetyl-CoA carboxylase carboxyltransferase component
VSKLYVNSPFVVGDEIKDSDFSAKNGTSAYCAESEAEAFAFVKKLVDMLPSNNTEGAFTGAVADDMNRVVGIDPENYTATEIIEKISDNGSFVRVYEKYCENVIAGFVTFGGILTCVVASDPAKKGILDIKTVRMIAKLAAFCDSFNIPLVNLIDSIGLDVSLESEYSAYSSELARLASVYASSSNAKISVVVGKAYGAAFTLASKALGSDIVYALPDACVSVLSPEASVAFVWNDKVGTDVTREEVEAEWKEKYASAAEACEIGEIDDIIDPSELRKRICAALSMLAYKTDCAPSRKHVNLPL